MKNKYYHYISSRIIRYTLSYIKKCLLSLYTLLLLKNKYCYYTSSHIMRTNIS